MKSCLLYHGTNIGYHRLKIREFGRYQHIEPGELRRQDDLHRIHFFPTPVPAMTYAVENEQRHGYAPILLVVKTELITPDADLVWTPFLTCKYLERESGIGFSASN